MQTKVEELSDDCVRSKTQGVEVNNLRFELEKSRSKIDSLNDYHHEEMAQMNREQDNRVEKLEHQLEQEINRNEAYKREVATERDIQIRDLRQMKVELII